MITPAQAISAFLGGPAADTAAAGIVLYDAGVTAGSDAALADAMLDRPDALSETERARAELLLGRAPLNSRWTTAGDISRLFGDPKIVVDAFLPALHSAASPSLLQEVYTSGLGRSAGVERKYKQAAAAGGDSGRPPAKQKSLRDFLAHLTRLQTGLAQAESSADHLKLLAKARILRHEYSGAAAAMAAGAQEDFDCRRALAFWAAAGEKGALRDIANLIQQGNRTILRDFMEAVEAADVSAIEKLGNYLHSDAREALQRETADHVPTATLSEFLRTDLPTGSRDVLTGRLNKLARLGNGASLQALMDAASRGDPMASTALVDLTHPEVSSGTKAHVKRFLTDRVVAGDENVLEMLGGYAAWSQIAWMILQDAAQDAKTPEKKAARVRQILEESSVQALDRKVENGEVLVIEILVRRADWDLEARRYLKGAGWSAYGGRLDPEHPSYKGMADALEIVHALDRVRPYGKDVGNILRSASAAPFIQAIQAQRDSILDPFQHASVSPLEALGILVSGMHPEAERLLTVIGEAEEMIVQGGLRPEDSVFSQIRVDQIEVAAHREETFEQAFALLGYLTSEQNYDALAVLLRLRRKGVQTEGIEAILASRIIIPSVYMNAARSPDPSPSILRVVLELALGGDEEAMKIAINLKRNENENMQKVLDEAIDRGEMGVLDLMGEALVMENVTTIPPATLMERQLFQRKYFKGFSTELVVHGLIERFDRRRVAEHVVEKYRSDEDFGKAVNELTEATSVIPGAEQLPWEMRAKLLVALLMHSGVQFDGEGNIDIASLQRAKTDMEKREEGWFNIRQILTEAWGEEDTRYPESRERIINDFQAMDAFNAKEAFDHLIRMVSRPRSN